MSVFKQFLAKDIIVTPFEINKYFRYDGGSSFIASNVGIDRFYAISGSDSKSYFDSASYNKSGQISQSYDYLTWSSIKQLYYSNFLTSSLGDSAPQTLIVNGVFISGSNKQPTYENYLQTTLTQSRYFPTSSQKIAVVSIPAKLYGNYIQPNSFYLEAWGEVYTDDGEGNILYNRDKVGDIIYSHGIITIINVEEWQIDDIVTANEVSCSFSSSFSIYETQYKCTIRENEFNYSLNPTLISSSDGTPYQYTTGSFFSPYITTIGLYNDNQDLLAVAKFAQPIPSSRTTDMNLIINLDR